MHLSEWCHWVNLFLIFSLSTIAFDFCLLESMNLAYQRVQRVDCTSPRPVLILGPLVDAVKDMLVKESPGRFCRCPLGRCPSLSIWVQSLLLCPGFNREIHFASYFLCKVLHIKMFCLLEVMKASQQAIERGVKDCLFIDYKRRSGHFDVTTVASIKEITEKVNLKAVSRSII